MHRLVRMVRLIMLEVAEGDLPEELTWAIMVLLLKEKGDYQGIVRVEVAWKVCVVVMNLRLKKGMNLYNSLHWFQGGSGMGAATLKTKVSQQLDSLTHEKLFQVFLDVWKSYDLLDRGRCLEILRGYGMGTNLA